MFRDQGQPRTDRQNRLLAGYLAFVGGFVNVGGFVVLGRFSSHVTGSVGLAAHALAFGDLTPAVVAVVMITAFFAGAVTASVVVESGAFGRAAPSYAVALAIEAILLLSFTGLVPRLHLMRDAMLEPALLAGAMGLQNSLVTRLSGAVVRTTHLTGVVTDLGIETARWARYGRRVLGERLGISLLIGQNEAELPALPKTLLLATIAIAFVIGAMTGAHVVVWLGHRAMLIPAALVIAFAAYAIANGRARDEAVKPLRK